MNRPLIKSYVVGFSSRIGWKVYRKREDYFRQNRIEDLIKVFDVRALDKRHAITEAQGQYKKGSR